MSGWIRGGNPSICCAWCDQVLYFCIISWPFLCISSSWGFVFWDAEIWQKHAVLSRSAQNRLSECCDMMIGFVFVHFFSIFFPAMLRSSFFFYHFWNFCFQRLWRCNFSIGVLGFRYVVMNGIRSKVVMYLSVHGEYAYNDLFNYHAERKAPVIVTLMAWNDPGNTGRKRHLKRCRSLYLPGQRNSWTLSTILIKKEEVRS